MKLLTTLKGQILALCLLCLILALAALTTANFLAVRSQTYQALTAQSQMLADSHALALQDWVKAKAAVVQTAATALDAPEPVAVLQRLKAAGGFLLTYFGYANKQSVFSQSLDLPADFDPTSRPWYQQAAAQSNDYILTAPYEDVSGAGLVVTFASTARSGNSVTGVAAGDISLQSVVANVTSIRPTPSSYAILVNRTGTIIAHPDAQLSLQPSTQLAADFTASALGTMAQNQGLQAMELAGRSMLVTATPIDGTDWVLVIASDKAEALQGISQLLQNAVITGMVVLLIAAAALAAVLAYRLKQLTLVRNAMHEIGEGDGDLSRRIDAQGNNELAQIAHSFNNFASKLSGVLGHIRDSSQSVRQASEEIALGNQDLSNRTEMTASSLQQTTASMEQLTETVRQNADAALQANQVVAKAASVATQGASVMGQAVSSMEEIRQASHKIGDIIGVIDGIAFQTNILALNAAVEAARAGEQGRGFAVVASEVRSLAGRSAEAAREIKQLISASLSQVETGAGLVQNAGATMQEMVQSVQQVTDIMAEISASSSEQSTSIQEVGQAISHLDQMTQQNAALVEESSAAAASLKEQSLQLAQAVGTFRLQAGASSQRLTHSA